jgi:hypothetical protein
MNETRKKMKVRNSEKGRIRVPNPTVQSIRGKKVENPGVPVTENQIKILPTGKTNREYEGEEREDQDYMEPRELGMGGEIRRANSSGHQFTGRQGSLNLFKPNDAITPSKRVGNSLRITEGSKSSKVTAFGNPQVRGKWVDNRQYQCHERYDEKVWLSPDVQYVVLVVAENSQANYRSNVKEKLTVTKSQSKLRDVLKKALQYIEEKGTQSDYGLQPRIDKEKVYTDLGLQRIKEELVAAVRIARDWMEDCRIECENNKESANGAAKGRSFASANNVYFALVSMIQVFDELTWNGARYVDEACNEIILDWTMLWIMIAELTNILRPVVMNMQDATQVLKENADMHVRRTTNDEQQYMRVSGNTSRPMSTPSLYSVERYPQRERREPPPQPSDAELEYVSSTQEDTQSRNSNQSVREVGLKGPKPRNPIREPFPTSDLLDQHRISNSFKCRQIMVNPLRPHVAKDGTREVVKVDFWRLVVATPRKGQADEITTRAEVYARVAFAADGTMGYRACGWEMEVDKVLGDSDMNPIYHAITDTTTLGKETSNLEPHWIETLWKMLESQHTAVAVGDYQCPSVRGVAKENYEFQITQHWGNIAPTRTSDRVSNPHARMGSFYELTANNGEALEDLQQMFDTPVPYGPMDRPQDQAGPSV